MVWLVSRLIELQWEKEMESNLLEELVLEIYVTFNS